MQCKLGYDRVTFYMFGTKSSHFVQVRVPEMLLPPSRTRFTIKDELQFQYPTTVHNVVEVRKAGYYACNSFSPIATFLTGNDVIPLATIGTWYFIYGVLGYCIIDMKVQVNVKSKALRPVQRCRGTGKRLRCQSETVLNSATMAGIDQSTVAWLGLAVVTAGVVLLF